jgi:serine/threonine protein kinase
MGSPIDRIDGVEQTIEEARGVDSTSTVARNETNLHSVYEARHPRLNRVVALKMMRDGSLPDDIELIRFRNEAEAVARLDHRHIVPIYEVGEAGGKPYLSMKLVRVESLAELVLKMTADYRPSAVVVGKAAAAVQHAHERGILHRDLKPANVLVDEWGEPHVTDFWAGPAHRQGERPHPVGCHHGHDRLHGTGAGRDSASRRELANNQIFVGEILLPMGRFDDARRAFEEARTTLQPLVTGTSTHGDAMTILASRYRAEGTLSVHAGKPGPAVDYLKRALEILTKLSRESRESGSLDGVPQIERSMAECLDRLGQAHTYAGQYEESLRALEEERPILEGLTKRHPDDLDVLYSLANCYRTIGSVMLRTSDSNDAMTPLQHATALLQRLIDLNPHCDEIPYRTSDGPAESGTHSRLSGPLQRGLGLLQASFADRGAAGPRDPNMADHQSSLMQCLGNVGLITAWSGRARESLPYLARGLELANGSPVPSRRLHLEQPISLIASERAGSWR